MLHGLARKGSHLIFRLMKNTTNNRSCFDLLGKPPWQQKPGEKVGKPGQAWFNQAHQAFYKKTNLVKRLVSLVLPGCSGKAGSKLP